MSLASGVRRHKDLIHPELKGRVASDQQLSSSSVPLVGNNNVSSPAVRHNAALRTHPV